METKDKALTSAEAMKECPYLVSTGVKENTFMGVYILPSDKTWWLTIPEENPELLGARTVKAFWTDNLVYPEDYEPRIPEMKSEASPCGSDCTTCPMIKERGCEGCPATIHYTG